MMWDIHTMRRCIIDYSAQDHIYGLCFRDTTTHFGFFGIGRKGWTNLASWQQWSLKQLIFERLFKLAKENEMENKVSGKGAVVFLQKSGIDRKHLRTIWGIS